MNVGQAELVHRQIALLFSHFTYIIDIDIDIVATKNLFIYACTLRVRCGTHAVMRRDRVCMELCCHTKNTHKLVNENTNKNTKVTWTLNDKQQRKHKKKRKKLIKLLCRDNVWTSAACHRRLYLRCTCTRACITHACSRRTLSVWLCWTHFSLVLARRTRTCASVNYRICSHFFWIGARLTFPYRKKDKKKIRCRSNSCAKSSHDDDATM